MLTPPRHRYKLAHTRREMILFQCGLFVLLQLFCCPPLGDDLALAAWQTRTSALRFTSMFVLLYLHCSTQTKNCKEKSEMFWRFVSLVLWLLASFAFWRFRARWEHYLVLLWGQCKRAGIVFILLLAKKEGPGTVIPGLPF